MEREAVLKTLETSLNRIIRQVDDLAYRADALEDDERIVYADHVQELRRQEESLRQRLGSLEKVREGDWRRLRAGLDQAIVDFQKAVEKTTLMLRDIA